MIRLTLFLSILITNVKSQSKLDFGGILADTNFSLTSGLFNGEKECGLDSIIKSKNELEIRLSVGHLPSTAWDEFVIVFNKGIWSTTKFSYLFGRKSFDSLNPIEVFKLKPTMGFDSLFINLKANKIFILPSQEKLNVKEDISDGTRYILTFKAGEKYRTYYFNNPSLYQIEYPDKLEFKYYSNISLLFNRELQKF